MGRVGKAFAIAAMAGAVAGTSALMSTDAARAEERGLASFSSNAELRAYLKRLRKRQQPEAIVVPEPVPLPVLAPPPVESEADDAAGNIVVTGSRVAPSITNNQEANVDEGGIVKQRGDTLIVLRRGRLFTISLAGGAMRVVDRINAFPPSVRGDDSWYDEMLVAGDRVVVIGYSYGRGGTEINRFRLDPAGRLRFEDAYHLRSNDYYSSRNYASRLIGNRLITYAPLDLDWDEDPLEALPGFRRWTGKEEAMFAPTAPARRIYIPDALRRSRHANIEALHTVTSCDLTAANMRCTATGVLGPASRSFYVSGEAVYLWLSNAWSEDADRKGADAFIYRLPLGDERPGAVMARGAPVDQFSFREDRADGVLNVVVREEGDGDAMWRPEVSEGDVALLRVPLDTFDDGSKEVALRRYRPLPKAADDDGNFRNRFVGAHLLYAGDEGDGKPSEVVVVPVRGGPVTKVPLGHGVGRLEALGRDALVVGEDARKGLNFSAIELGSQPRVGDLYRLPAAQEGESRSHGFFFRSGNADGTSGLLGLPVARAADPRWARFFGSSAAMLFLNRDARRFSPAGELAAQPREVEDDRCVASCVDWYGNARPIFIGDRVFALLGYELVEGSTAAGGRINEVGRVNFAPRGGARD